MSVAEAQHSAGVCIIYGEMIPDPFFN
jgi:hypothetical protein